MFDYTYKIYFEDGTKEEIVTGDGNVERMVKETEQDKNKKATKIIVEDSKGKRKFVKENNKIYEIEDDGSKTQVLWVKDNF
ncbi:MAG: hypothetical protein ACOCV1_03445 [Bacillota bacterium]